MSRRLQSARALLRTPISRGQLVLVAVASLVATGAILVGGQGRTPAQTLALAALRDGNYLVRVSGSGAASAGIASGSDAATSPATDAATASASASGDGGSNGSVAADNSAVGADSGITTTDTTGTGTATSSTIPATQPKAGHVFVISLSTTSFEAAFGTRSPARYLNRTLKAEGTFLGGYESLGATELPDLLAMLSGQPPNPDTQTGCASYADFGSGVKPGSDGTVPGSGCVYPNTVLTIADQATSAGKSWRAYIDGIGSTPCPHPNSGAADSSEPPGAGPGYDTRHNPFIYFHSLLDLGGCASNDVSIDQLAADLGRPSRTPAYAFVAPGLCADAAATSCGGDGGFGLAAEDASLRRWVPKIFSSPAYRKYGVLIIAFSLTPAPGSAAPPASGGSAPTGALVLSPHTSRGKTVSTTYDAYSLLRTTEDLLGYKPLAEAKAAKSFADLAAN